MELAEIEYGISLQLRIVLFGELHECFEIFAIIHNHLGVQYIYQEDQNQGPFLAAGKMHEQSLVKPLMELPEEMITRLKEAVELSDAAMIDEMIKEISLVNYELGQALAKMAESFAYDTILTLIKNK